jgi:hypothetical protein
MLVCIGVDLGLSGAIAAIGPDPGTAHVADLPTIPTDGGKRLDTRGILELIRQWWPAKGTAMLVFEDVRARMQGNGGRAFNSMRSQTSLIESRGILLATCDVLRLSPVLVQPASWKRKYGLIGAEKDASRQTALRLFPKMEPALKRKADHNRAEALLLAHYLYSAEL